MDYLSIVDSQGNPIPKETVAGIYEGASSGRRLSTWGMSSAGPNASLYSSIGTLRSRARELTRNNSHADGAVETFVANLIGNGITPRWRRLKDDTELKEEIQGLWNDWTVEADAAETCDFYGLQALVAHELIEAGEILVRFRPRRLEDDLAVPLQLQVIEADHLDEHYNTRAPNGNDVRMGIEFNAIGQRTAYWLHRDHPGEMFLTAQGGRVRVPASEIIHVFKPVRAGQIRGRSWFSSIILELHEIDQCVDAELVRRKTTAMFGGFIIQQANENNNPNYNPLGPKKGETTEGQPIVAIEPGQFPVLKNGLDVRFSQPRDVSGSYIDWMKQQLRDVAMGFGVTYEQLTGDLTDVNYSSIRAGLLEFRRRCRMLQMQVIAHQFCRRVVNYWLDTAVASGELRIPDYRKNRRKYKSVTWRPDGWDWVDPVKDRLGEQMDVRNGFKSRSQVIAERGGDPEAVDSEIAEDNARADKLSLIFDSDPRYTAKTGTMQDAEDRGSITE